MPLSDMMPSSRSLSGLCCRRGVGARSSIAVQRLFERRVAQPPVGSNERLVGALALRDVEIDQPLDGIGYVFDDEAVAEDVADRGVLRRVTADADLVELGTL